MASKLTKEDLIVWLKNMQVKNLAEGLTEEEDLMIRELMVASSAAAANRQPDEAWLRKGGFVGGGEFNSKEVLVIGEALQVSALETIPTVRCYLPTTHSPMRFAFYRGDGMYEPIPLFLSRTRRQVVFWLAELGVAFKG